MERRRSAFVGRARAALLLLLAALAATAGPVAYARPAPAEGEGGRADAPLDDYSDDALGDGDGGGALGADALPPPTAKGGGGGLDDAAIAAAAAAVRGMRASEVGFAGARFGGAAPYDLTAAAASPLLRACAPERAAFCGGGGGGRAQRRGGDGRLLRCLAARAGSDAFGGACRVALAARVHGRQVSWRLDHRLVAACGEDARLLCPAADAQEAARAAAAAAAAADPSGESNARGGGGGAVLRCLERHASSSGAAAAGVLAEACEAELSRAAHAFLFLWAPGGPLTSACDADARRLCLVADPGLAQTPGAVDACLVGVHRGEEQRRRDEAAAAGAAGAGAGPRDDRRLGPRCQALLRLSGAGRERALRREFSASLALYAAMHSGVGLLERGSGLTVAERDAGGAKIVGLTPAGAGAVAGVVVGALLALGLAVGGIVWCARRGRRRGLMAGEGKGPGQGPGPGQGQAQAQQQQKVAAAFIQMAPLATPPAIKLGGAG